MFLLKKTCDKKTANKFKDQILSIIITISPILLQYHFVILTYGLICLTLVYVFICIKYKKFFIDKDFIKLGVLLFIQQNCSMIIFDTYSKSFVNTIIMVELMSLIVVLGYFIEDKDILYDSLKKFAIFCTVILILQFVLHIFAGIDYKAIILIPQSEEYLNIWITNRPASLFTEPQTYSTFMILILICVLNKKDMVLVPFFLIGIILSGSSSGILISILLVLYYLIRNKNIKMQTKVISLIAALIIIALLFTMPIFSKYVEKIATIFNDMSEYSNAKIVNSHSYTNYLRLFKGWQTFFDMPFKEKMIGIGINNFMSYLKTTEVIFMWNSIWDNSARMAGYYTSAGGVFIDCGLIVAIYYYIFLIKKYNKANTENSKGILMLIAVHSIYSQIFFNHIFLYHFIFYNAFLENDSKKEIKLEKENE